MAASKTRRVEKTDVPLLLEKLDNGEAPRVYLADGIPNRGINPMHRAKVHRYDHETGELYVQPTTLKDSMAFELEELLVESNEDEPTTTTDNPTTDTEIQTKPASKPKTTKRTSSKSAVTISISCEHANSWYVHVQVGAKATVKTRKLPLSDAIPVIEQLGSDVSDAIRPLLETVQQELEQREAEAQKAVEETQSELAALRNAVPQDSA